MAQEKKQSESLFISAQGEKVFEEKRLPSNYLFTTPEFTEAIGIAAAKLGYTTQNVDQRIQQWKHHSSIYRDITLVAVHPAYFDTKDGERVYYLDHALHRLLEIQDYDKLVNLQHVVAKYPNDKISHEYYYSKRDRKAYLNGDSLRALAAELQQHYEDGTAPSGINFYKDFKSTSAPIARSFYPIYDFEPRLFQENAINKASKYFLHFFDETWDYGKHKEGLSCDGDDRNFLLSAPTRSGKSFMAAMIAKRIVEHLQNLGKTQNIILVVSGIADVMIEWQKAFQQHRKLNQKNEDGTGNTLFHFLTRRELEEKGASALDEAFANGAENVVIALTLQDLSGSFKQSKNENFVAHDFLMPRKDGSSPVDFLIVDEAHFAAFNRVGEYRSMIAPTDYDTKDESEDGLSNEPMTDEEFAEASKEFQRINPTVGTLYVSATPYNELIGGDMFSVHRKNMHIISKSDIEREMIQWRLENPDRPEWESPYFGLPKQHYFAVDPLDSIDNVLSVDKTGKFIKYNAAHSLIWNFFGYQFNGAFHFPQIVNDPEYVKAGLGNHIIVTVGSCLQADAVEDSLKKLREKDSSFDYKVMNLSSDESSHEYRKKTAEDITREIEIAHNEGVKTFTITVDRLSTGVTVKEWDTVVFWRQMSSAQKFDQMAGRAGTPFVVSMQDESGDNTIKRCEKPNIAVLSYAPDQMLEIVHQNALTIAKVKQDERSPRTLTELLDDELTVIPTYTLSGGDHMVRMNANNILDAVLEAYKGKGPREYAEKVLLNIAGITSNTDLLNKVMQLDANDGNLSTNIAVFEKPEIKDGECHVYGCKTPAVESNIPKYGNKYCEQHIVFQQLIDNEKSSKTTKPSQDDGTGEKTVSPETVNNNVLREAEAERKRIEDRIRNLISILLMFVALSPRDESSLLDVIQSIEDESDTTGRRIAHHLGLDVEFLKELHHAGTFNYTLDTQFYLINKTLEDVDEHSTIGEMWKSMAILITGFGNFSPNEVPTPEAVARLLVDKAGLTDAFWKKLSTELQDDESLANAVTVFNRLVHENFKNNHISMHRHGDRIRFIDNGCKSAVIFVEIARRAEKYGVPLDMFEFYAVPTSPATYELIRKVYEFMKWDLDHILFIEGIDTSDINKLLMIESEKVAGCQFNENLGCPFHSRATKSVRKRYGIESIPEPGKNADEKVWIEYSEKVLSTAFEYIFDSIDDRKTQAAARDAWGRMKITIQKFDYAISNPPYQIETGGDYKDSTRKTYSRIYDVFYKDAFNISNSVVMVYPSSWQSSITKGFGKWLIDNGLQSVENCNGTDLFGDVIEKNYPINITVSFKGYNEEVKVNDIILNRNSSLWIDTKKKEIAYSRTKNYPGLLTPYDLTDLKNIESSPIVFYELPNLLKDPVKFYIKKTSTTAADGGYYYVEKDELIKHYFNEDELALYNVSIQAMFFKQMRNFKRVESGDLNNFKAIVSGENEGFAQTWINLRSFNTQEEAVNFSDYFNSKIPTILATIVTSKSDFASAVPDLGDYTNANPVFTPDADLPENHEYKGMSLDQRLYKLFELSDEEIEIIEQS